MIKIEITSAEVSTKSGTSSKTGRAYSIREQTAYAHTHDRAGVLNKYPVSLRIALDDNQEPYKPGLYTLAPESLYTDRFDTLAIRPVLKPLASVTTAPKAA